MFLFTLKKNFLGVDIGSSAIRIIELSSFAKKIKLENFGEIPSRTVFREPFRTSEKSILHLSIDNVIEGIHSILEEAQIKTKAAFFSIPDFATFFTTFELPPMTKQEVPLAVEVEARKHIPVPISDVIFDWQIIDSIPVGKRERLKILMVAVPHEIINQYQIIAEKTGLKLVSMETEVFSLARVFGEEGKIISILDLGAKTTTCNIIENKILKRSFSLDIGGNSLSEKIAKNLGIGLEEGEKLKKEFGIEERGRNIREILLPSIDSIFKEIERIFQEYEAKEKKSIEKIILSGGGARLPGLEEYARMQLKRKIEVGYPFTKVIYPSILEETLKEIGPSFSIAVGLALRGFVK